jgi:outer membrane protein TolC
MFGRHLIHLIGLIGLTSAFPVNAIDISYSDSITLNDVMIARYEKLPAKEMEDSFGVMAQANQDRAATYFSEPITANLNHYNDAVGSSDGFQEWEGSVDLPLWLPGQQAKHQNLATAYNDQLPVYARQLQLVASEDVRTLIWAVKIAETDVKQAELALSSAQQLKKDIDTRVEAGELPPSSAVRADIHQLSTQHALASVNAQLKEAWSLYQTKTGYNELPKDYVEPLLDIGTINDSHPMIQWHDEQIALLQAKLSLAQIEGQSGPTVSLGLRRERGEYGESFNHSLGLGVSMPFDDSRHRQPAIAEASAAIAEAQVERQAKWVELTEQLHLQNAELIQKQNELTLIKEQEATTASYVDIQNQAFDLGEIGLTELLNTQQLFQDIQAKRQQLEILIQYQIALINQTLGHRL